MNGPHLATGRFEVGNFNLKSEQSNNIDLSFNYSNDGFYADLTFFQNNVDNYIYLMDETEEDHADHGDHDDHDGLTLANYLQQDAEFKGYELEIGKTFDLARGALTLAFGRDSVSGEFTDGHNIPRMTPERDLYKVVYVEDTLKFVLSLKDVSAQNDKAENETASDGFQMLNLNLSKTIESSSGNILTLSVFGKNLLDEVARNHSSFVKDEVPLAGRNKKLSPAHDQITKKGGQMGAYNGWERANWFAHTTDDITEKATQTWKRSGPWEQRIKEECYAVRDEVGVLDLPGFSRFDIEGKGTAAWLKERIAGSLPKIGRLNLAYFADKRGRTLSEMSVIRHSEEKFTLITAASAQWHDWDIVNKASSKNISVTDNTNSISTLIVTGPKSRDLLEKIGTNADLYLPWLSHQKAKVCGQPCHLMRVSFAGELGWEIHTKVENISKLYKEITEAGAKPFGMWALNSLRIEKGYRAWKGDLSTDYSLQEAGLSRFIQFDKEENFLGKAALEIERQQGIKKQFVTLIVSAGECDAPYMSTLWKNGQIVGETTSGAWGYRTNSSIALGMIRSDLASAGTEIEVEIFGDRHNAVVQANGSIWDPLNERLRA